MSENQPIVLDNGSGTIFAGLGGDDLPSCVFPNCIGNGAEAVNFIDFSNPGVYKGFVKSVSAGDLKVEYPMDHGVINNWDDMETIWSHTFSELALNINPEEFNLLITEPIHNPKPNREKIAQILLEKFNFPAISVSQSPILPLYSAGLTTGLVLDCGEGVMQAVPVYQGYPINDAMIRSDIGGRDVTRYLEILLQESGHKTRPFEVIKLLKEKVCYTAKNYDEEISKKVEQAQFQLPDGEIVEMGDERFRCVELLFDPSLKDGSDDKLGIHKILYKSIMKTNIDIRKDLYSTIVLSGGSTLFPGFERRLAKEINALVPSKAKVEIRADLTRKYAVWRGGSVLASLANFYKLLISKEDFAEFGPSIIHKIN